MPHAALVPELHPSGTVHRGGHGPRKQCTRRGRRGKEPHIERPARDRHRTRTPDHGRAVLGLEEHFLQRARIGQQAGKTAPRKYRDPGRGKAAAAHLLARMRRAVEDHGAEARGRQAQRGHAAREAAADHHGIDLRRNGIEWKERQRVHRAPTLPARFHQSRQRSGHARVIVHPSIPASRASDSISARACAARTLALASKCTTGEREST